MCSDDCGSAIVPDPIITTLDPAATLGGRNNLTRSLELSKVPCLVSAAVDCDHTTAPISSTATTALKQTFLFILPPSGGFLDPKTRRLMGYSAADWFEHARSAAQTVWLSDSAARPKFVSSENGGNAHWVLLGISKTEGKRRHRGTKTVLPLRDA